MCVLKVCKFTSMYSRVDTYETHSTTQHSTASFHTTQHTYKHDATQTYTKPFSYRHFVSKRRPVKTIEQLIALPATERRHVLRSLSDEEFNEVLIVCRRMPKIEMEVNYEGEGEALVCDGGESDAGESEGVFECVRVSLCVSVCF